MPDVHMNLYPKTLPHSTVDGEGMKRSVEAATKLAKMRGVVSVIESRR